MEQRARIIRFGVYSYAGIVLLFLLCKLLGWENNPYLRPLNFVIIFYFTNRLARLYNMQLKENGYLRMFTALALSNFVTVALSVLSFALYATLLDPGFITHFVGGFLWTDHITLKEACLALTLEGLASGVTLSFILMQYWKVERKHPGMESATIRK